MATTIERFITRVTVEGAKQLEQLGTTADTVNKKLSGLTSTLIGISFGALIAGAMRSADELTDLSAATGISIASLKGFGEALRASGGDAKNTEKNIMTLYAAIESAADGSEKSQQAFQRVGVSLQDLQNLSEADILNKTIKGLSEMAAGSERSRIATILLGRSFRGIDTETFLKSLDPARYQKFEEDALKAGAAIEKMEVAFGHLQTAALAFVGPIIDQFGDVELGANAAEKAVRLIGITFALVFGAKAIASIVAFNRTLGITVGLANLLGKSPVGLLAKVLAVGATTAAAAGTVLALEELMSANDELEKSAKAAGEAQGKVVTTNPQAGSAGRTVSQTPAQIAAAKKAADEKVKIETALSESQKRIQQSVAEYERTLALDNVDEIHNIRVNAAADIRKMEAEVRAQTLLDGINQEAEIAQRRTEINAKAAKDISKIESEALRNTQLQVGNIQEQTRALEEKFMLTQRIQDMGPIQAEREQRIAEAYEEQRRLLREVSLEKGLAEPNRLARETAINKALEDRLGLINREADLKISREQDFSLGVQRAMKDFEQSMTPLKQGEDMARSVFGNMTSALDNFVETGKFNFGDFARSIIVDLMKIQLRAAAVKVFTAAFGGMGFANGAAFSGGKVTPFANGGVVGGPTLFPMANGMGLMGEAGPEAIMPLKRGKDGKLGVASQGGTGSQVTNNYYSISAVDSRSVAQLFSENRMTLLGTVRQAEKELPFRGR
jgi:lambda family phage tail tape measure protein